MDKWSVTIVSSGPLNVESFVAEGDKLTLVPNFYGTGRIAHSAIIKVHGPGGELLSTAVLQVSGANGKVHIHDISTPTGPAMSRKRSKKKESDAQPPTN